VNFIANMFLEGIDMKARNALGVILLTVLLGVFISLSVFGKTEKEPNITKDSPHVPGSHEGKRILPPLKYKLTVRQDGVPSQSDRPENSQAASASDTTSGSSTALGSYTMKRLHENNFGFSFELPDSWLRDPLPDNGGYVLSGPAGTEENEVIIVVQAVKKAAKPDSSAAKQLQEIKEQIQGISGAEIRSEDMVTVSGRQVPFILALYPGLTASREPATFAHVQLVVENEFYYIWISYAAPIRYFHKYQEVFANLLTSFQIVAAGGPSRTNEPPGPEKAEGRITVQAFHADSNSLSAARVKVKAQGFGTGVKRLKLFAVSVDGKLRELESAPCTDGATVEFNAIYNNLETKSFELRLYDAQDKVIARLQRSNA
jgi:hypothetical protein